MTDTDVIDGQLTLDDAPLYRHSDLDTARNAASIQTPGRRSHGQRAVLKTLAERGQRTDFGYECVGLTQTSAGKRRLELQRAGLVADSGRRAPSPTGTPAAVWQITPAGVDCYQQMLAAGDLDDIDWRDR